MSTMRINAVASNVLFTLDHSAIAAYPFRHWLLSQVLPDRTCIAIDRLAFAPPPIGKTFGKRATHSSTRLFFNEAQQAANAVCDEVATGLQSGAVVRQLQTMCGVIFGGSFLRIKYCLDTNGFWLEPHTHIGAKLFTMLIYLSDDPGSEAWETDLLAGPEQQVLATPNQRNLGFIFIPSADGWHDFHRWPIVGIRRSLIVNYVKPEWRLRQDSPFRMRPHWARAGSPETGLCPEKKELLKRDGVNPTL